jgi:hypothetical protein
VGLLSLLHGESSDWGWVRRSSNIEGGEGLRIYLIGSRGQPIRSDQLVWEFEHGTKISLTQHEFKKS